ncbi:MAG: electron transport complex subunit RsxA [Clostridiales bacterium GWF2_38_85]|nr:MAG: electron transport complex subunit RsxA [Clostridiales bacterium GWF2_38_85]HBL85046.1 electron transport complex subunit RsxA [Clostridiales bacterium]
MKEMLLIIVSAILIDNFIFSKFLGICPFLGVSEKTDTALSMGFAVTFVMTVSSAVTYFIYYGVLVPFNLTYLKTIAFILVIAALVQLIEMFMKKAFPPLYQALGIYLPLITTNCAVLGVTLLNIQYEYNFINSVVYGFASAVGFTLAIVIFAGVRQRLQLSDPPKAFRGIPLALISAGLIAMAFMGFQGMEF